MAESDAILAALETALDSLGVASLRLDGEARVTGWNRQFLRIFPAAAGRIRRGLPHPDLPHEDPQPFRRLRDVTLTRPGLGVLRAWAVMRPGEEVAGLAADDGATDAACDAPVAWGGLRPGQPEAFLDALGIASLGLDDGARMLGWNRTFLHLFPEQAGHLRHGEPYAENLRRFYRARLDAAEAPNLESYVADGVARHERQAEPFEFLHHGRWLRVGVLPLPGRGRVRVWRAVAPPQDGARVAAQMAHAGKLSAFGAMDQIADGLMVRDAQDRILLANRPFAELYGIEAPEFAIGKSFRDLLHGAWEGLPGAALAHRRWADNSRFAGAPFELPLPGDRWVRVRDYRSHDGSLVSTHVDVTDLVRLRRSAHEAQLRAEDLAAQLGTEMEERKRAEARTIQLARLASLSEMATGLAHELNQPLAALTLAADRAQSRLRRDGAAAIPDALERLERVATAALRARDILDRLRRFGRMEAEAAAPESVDVGEAVGSAMALTRATIDAAGIALSARLPAAPIRVMAHPAALEQVIANLLLNARDAVAAHRAAAGAIEVALAQQDGTAVLTVADNGGGFTEAALRRGFEPFFTTKPPGKGPGIGLSVAYATIQSAGGRIALANRGAGALVTVQLPVRAGMRHDPED